MNKMSLPAIFYLFLIGVILFGTAGISDRNLASAHPLVKDEISEDSSE